jgi:hypothetical protein
MAGSALAAARLRRVFTAEIGARFFDGRFLVSRVVLRERGFAAMIPLSPIGAKECHGRAR